MFQRVPSTDRIRAELGWEPTVDLDGILSEVIEHERMAGADGAERPLSRAADSTK
jgi:nucleoside-diphosphate-sugar epimerase